MNNQCHRHFILVQTLVHQITIYIGIVGPIVLDRTRTLTGRARTIRYVGTLALPYLYVTAGPFRADENRDENAFLISQGYRVN